MVRLASKSVATHRKRYQDFAAADWQQLQRLVTEGEWTENRGARLLRIVDEGKSWMGVLRRTRRDEIYLASYRRATPREAVKWQARQD